MHPTPLAPSPQRFMRWRWLALAIAVSAGAQAADTPSPAPAANDPLATPRALIASKDWAGALAELRKINDSGSANWNNLMGYTLRKQRTPELDTAERHYKEALRLDPKHRGAHEYIGELYLMRGDLKSAETHLAALDRLCLLPCEEYTDLKEAVARFKANGNRHAPK